MTLTKKEELLENFLFIQVAFENGEKKAKHEADKKIKEMISRIENLISISDAVPGSRRGFEQSIKIIKDVAGIPE